MSTGKYGQMKMTATRLKVSAKLKSEQTATRPRGKKTMMIDDAKKEQLAVLVRRSSMLVLKRKEEGRGSKAEAKQYPTDWSSCPSVQYLSFGKSAVKGWYPNHQTTMAPNPRFKHQNPLMERTKIPPGKGNWSPWSIPRRSIIAYAHIFHPDHVNDHVHVPCPKGPFTPITSGRRCPSNEAVGDPQHDTLSRSCAWTVGKGQRHRGCASEFLPIVSIIGIIQISDCLRLCLSWIWPVECLISSMKTGCVVINPIPIAFAALFHLVMDLLMLVSGGNKGLWLVPQRLSLSPAPSNLDQVLSLHSLFPLLFIPVRSKTNLNNPGTLETFRVANF